MILNKTGGLKFSLILKNALTYNYDLNISDQKK